MEYLTKSKKSDYRISLTDQHISDFKKHLIDGFPNEQCGFIFGIREKNNHKTTEIKPVANIKEGDQKRRFEIDPLDYMKAENYALTNDMDLIGIYHSHPLHPATPSIHDYKQALESISYIIMSIDENSMIDLKSWRINEKLKFEEEKLIII